MENPIRQQGKLIVPRSVFEKIKGYDREEETTKALQTLITSAYFLVGNTAHRELRYSMIRALAKDLLGRDVDFAVLT